ncbi:hypothetical protein D210916BOD24_18640 [Alteromonas sp. D210916BOD_24]|uniref:PTS sugar transporter subunit IIA n=1 Tax=Alteromonas sp. D210916BOD_24 TaxID=3157618 RepID=UPI00399C6B62
MKNKLLPFPPEEFTKQVDISSPLSGQVMSMKDLDDPLLKHGFHGPGAVIVSTGNCITAPFDGTILKVIPLDYAVEVRSSVGLKCRIKYGGDTQHLHGAQFSCPLQQGQRFVAKQPLFTINSAWLKQQGVANICIMTVLNPQKLLGVLPTNRKYVEACEDPLFSLFV